MGTEANINYTIYSCVLAESIFSVSALSKIQYFLVFDIVFLNCKNKNKLEPAEEGDQADDDNEDSTSQVRPSSE